MVRILLNRVGKEDIEMGLFNRKKKQGMGLGLASHGRTPRSTEAQPAPEPERLTRPDEEADMAVHQLDDPPQAEGERTRN